YNTADARWRGPARSSGWLESPLGWPLKASAAAPVNLGLSRLPGSGPEIAACAREWQGASILLEGRDATKQNVRRALETRPAGGRWLRRDGPRPTMSAFFSGDFTVASGAPKRVTPPSRCRRRRSRRSRRATGARSRASGLLTLPLETIRTKECRQA